MLNRRTFLKSCAYFGTAALLSRRTVAQPARPNVLMIIVDDMNDYGFYGAYPGLKMPYLDAFKASATTFERAYCATPACIPSRAAVFSGLAPHLTGAYRNGSEPWQKPPFTTIEALPECFKRNGYTTFARGKILHSEPPDVRKNAMWDNECWGGGFGPFPPEKDQVKDQDDEFGHWWGCTPWEGPDEDFPDVVNVAATVDFLQESHDKPFFAVLGLWRPHTPFTAPKRFFELYDPATIRVPPPAWEKNDLDDVPPLGVELANVFGERYRLSGESTPEMWRRFLHGYLACTSFADDSCGKVLAALEASVYAENTIVVFWSDNGYHCGEKNHWEKTTLWEQAARIPMAMRVPGLGKPGARCPRTVNALDLYPTLLDLCGIDGPHQELSGRSLRPLLENPEADWDHPALTTYGEGYGSIRDERYRYLVYPDGTEELYDLDAAPYEHNNLASNPELAEVKKRLSTLLPKTYAKTFGGRLG